LVDVTGAAQAMYPRGKTVKSTHAAANRSPNSGATGALSWSNAPAEGT